MEKEMLMEKIKVTLKAKNLDKKEYVKQDLTKKSV